MVKSQSIGNLNKPSYTIPKKGTIEYEEVKRIADGMKKKQSPVKQEMVEDKIMKKPKRQSKKAKKDMIACLLVFIT